MSSHLLPVVPESHKFAADKLILESVTFPLNPSRLKASCPTRGLPSLPSLK